MNTKITKNLQNNVTLLKELLPAEDVLTYFFHTKDGTACAIVYADGIVNKQLLGELVARPLNRLSLSVTKEEVCEIAKNDDSRYEFNKNDGGRYDLKVLEHKIKTALLFPELKEESAFNTLVKEVLDGNSVLMVDGLTTAWVIGAKALPTRTVTEPPTDVAIKGPREGFIEDVKTNMSLVRKRLKTPNLRFELQKVGKQSDTNVAICYLDGVCNAENKKKILSKLKKIDIDCIVDSSYLATLLAPRTHSIFKQVGTTEKPDIFCAKLAEGRVGLLVDGSPIALTLPFILTEDLQTSEDYFISPFMATIFRTMRFFALVVALLLPAFYVTAQLFKLQLLPLGLTLTIAGSVQGLPLSPSMEIFVVVLLLEILKEASTRMPKYVGMSLSVVGALVLGETAVNAGILSTPAIIVVAISGICLYTVPNFVETGSILRWVFLLVAGSEGGFGIVILSTFLLYYLVSADGFGAPLLSPFSPLCMDDLKDSTLKYGFSGLENRPIFLSSNNKTRFRRK
ncbi:MAG: spore germination protein [Clostridia bacterium]|nr:spore germination protein [Clostridia bacterium]